MQTGSVASFNAEKGTGHAFVFEQVDGCPPKTLKVKLSTETQRVFEGGVERELKPRERPEVPGCAVVIWVEYEKRGDGCFATKWGIKA